MWLVSRWFTHIDQSKFSTSHYIRYSNNLIINLIIKAWNWVSNFGVSEEHPDENDLVILYNRMSLLSFIGGCCVTFLTWLLHFSQEYFYLSTSIMTVYLIVLSLNALGKIQYARYAISVCSAIWVGTSHVLVSGFFCQGLAMLTSMAITYVSFQNNKKTRQLLLIMHIVLFSIASVYISIYGPIWGEIDFPYDEIFVFIVGVGWIIVVLNSLDKDRSTLLQTLETSNKELKETTEQLERFTYIASHDLKSPLRTIISFIGLIEREIERENYSTLPEKLSFVKTSANQMNFLVEDILKLTKLKDFEESPMESIDLNIIMKKVLHNLQGDIEEKNAIINFKVLPHFFAKEVEILLLFQNFIQNGIKYNDSKQPIINIKSHIKNNTLSISFNDNGIGIEKAYFDQIFQFFKRLHSSKDYQGTGLGLGLCKKIIDQYKGEIKIDSEVGTGTTFTLTFPIVSLSQD